MDVKLNKKLDLALFCHEHRPVQPKHAERAGFGGLSALQHSMPKLATEGILERVAGTRKDPEDRYAGFIVGAEGRKLLKKHRGITIGATQSVDASDHGFFTTDISTELHLALGDMFTYRKVQQFETQNIHYERKDYGSREEVIKKRIKQTLRPDYSFITPWGLHHLEADNAGGVDESGKKRKGEPIRRKTVTEQQDLYKKILGYLGGLMYGRLVYRLLLVTRTQLRVFNIIEDLYPALYDVGGHKFQDFVLINYLDALQADRHGTWCNLAGLSRPLIPEEFQWASISATLDPLLATVGRN